MALRLSFSDDDDDDEESDDEESDDEEEVVQKGKRKKGADAEAASKKQKLDDSAAEGMHDWPLVVHVGDRRGNIACTGDKMFIQHCSPGPFKSLEIDSWVLSVCQEILSIEFFWSQSTEQQYFANCWLYFWHSASKSLAADDMLAMLQSFLFGNLCPQLSVDDWYKSQG